MATTRKRKTRARKERSRKKAVVYARVSSKDQEKEGFSIPSQLKLLRKHAADNDIEIDAEYVESESARKAGRRQFNRMIADLRKHSSDVGIVLCEKTDRLHRNLHDHATVDDLMNEMGVEFRFVKEGRSLSRDSGSGERLVQDIEAAMAKRYSANLSEEVRKGQLEKAEQGFYPGGPVPIGYMNVINSHGRKAVAIDEQRAPLVRKIFELYATGKYSIKQIGKEARSLGLTYRKSGRLIPNGTIHKILRRRFYMGKFDWKGKIYQGRHEPLVTKELWQKVQDVLDGRNASKLRQAKHDHAFARMMSCARCGCAVVGEPPKKGKYEYKYYHPTAWPSRCVGNPSSCRRSVSEAVLEEMFAYVFKALRFDEKILQLGMKAWRASQSDRTKDHEEAIARLRAEHSRLETRIDAAYEDKLDGTITPEIFDRKSKLWREDQDRCMSDIRQHEKDMKSRADDEARILEMLADPKALYDRCSVHEKRQLLDCIISECLWSGRCLSVTIRKPFDLLIDNEVDLETLAFFNELLGDDEKASPAAPVTSLYLDNHTLSLEDDIKELRENEARKQKFIEQLKREEASKPNPPPCKFPGDRARRFMEKVKHIT